MTAAVARMTVTCQTIRKPLSLIAALIVTPVALAFASDAVPVQRPSPVTAADLIELLDSGQIAQGTSDSLLRSENNGLQRTDNGRYSVFYREGMDVTDSISLISKDGAFIYATYGSCSESKTYFRSNVEYFRYLITAN